MADTKITGLTAIDAPVAADVLPIVDDPGGTPVTKKVTLTQIATLLQSIWTSLQFGGTSSSFPMLKRSTTVLQAKLADDSAFTDIQVLDDAYAAGWNGSQAVPTKNAVYDKMETKAASGANTDITSLTGTTTNDSAAAGKIGEIIASTVLTGSAVSLTNDTGANVTSISLTAGDWDVAAFGHFKFNAATTCTALYVSASQTSATSDTDPSRMAVRTFPIGTVLGATNPHSVIMPVSRFSLASTTTIYLVVLASFATNTCDAFGYLRARRVR